MSIHESIDEEAYRSELRNHFMGQVKNSKFQNSVNNYAKETALRHPKVADLREAEFQLSRHRHHQRTSGGDADRLLYEPSAYSMQNSTESYRPSSETTYLRQIHTKSRTITPALPSSNPTHKYHAEEINRYMYDSDSNAGGIGPGSDESPKSQKSSKTVVTKKSSQDLRKRVQSQCKLHEVIDETLKQMCGGIGIEHGTEDIERRIRDPSMQLQQPCKRCSDNFPPQAKSSQKDVMTEIAKGDFLDCRSGDTLTISVDDVVNSKVINPMIRKLQRMYLNNLKEEMSLMEDLERLPHKVNEVYKATIFKQKE